MLFYNGTNKGLSQEFKNGIDITDISYKPNNIHFLVDINNVKIIDTVCLIDKSVGLNDVKEAFINACLDTFMERTFEPDKYLKFVVVTKDSTFNYQLNPSEANILYKCLNEYCREETGYGLKDYLKDTYKDEQGLIEQDIEPISSDYEEER